MRKFTCIFFSLYYRYKFTSICKTLSPNYVSHITFTSYYNNCVYSYCCFVLFSSFVQYFEHFSTAIIKIWCISPSTVSQSFHRSTFYEVLSSPCWFSLMSHSTTVCNFSLGISLLNSSSLFSFHLFVNWLICNTRLISMLIILPFRSYWNWCCCQCCHL